ncbi:YceI-like domain-containing protein [Flavobacterium sp. 90]|uniref:YceI family protein n=1 Tax=unclassified Flavobacterium TaxID=196869 RepID=UPI000EB11F99|nr:MULTISPECIES: YceI family protein [unclassified Flavobacterium]RKR09362.1 YceI-like domain-containing protein [Flavobacterium sp. 81]TCK53146.1 YceI-like domain-containing protein [Flavobacterium sp. 90]
MKTIKPILLTIIFTTMALQTNAQKNYTVNTKSTFEVAGTSTVHDWVMKSTEGAGTANLTVKDSKLAGLNSLTITLPAESLKSNKTSMDQVAYEALDTETHQTIEYVLKSAEKINETIWVLTGTYTIAGISKEYKTQVRVTTDNGTFILQGSNQITFGDFEMTPPKAALGVVKTGKDLTLIFNIILS